MSIDVNQFCAVMLEATFLQFLLRARVSQRRNLHEWRLLAFCKLTL